MRKLLVFGFTLLLIALMVDAYMSGMSFKQAAESVGLKMPHGSVKRIFQNRTYLGTAYFPAILTADVFDALEEERLLREKAYGRGNISCRLPSAVIWTEYKIGAGQAYGEDPFAVAEAKYRMIERRA